MALAAWIALAAVLHLSALGTGFVERDLVAIDTVLRTRLDALLRGGAFESGFAPLSQELWWWTWSRAIPLGALPLHLMNALVASLAAWAIVRAGARWGGVRAGALAGLLWTCFPPLAGVLAQASGARELIAALACAAGIAAFASGRWILAGLACGAASLSGVEAAGLPVALLAADLAERPRDAPWSRARRLSLAFALGIGAAAWVVRASVPAARQSAGVHALSWFARAWAPAGAGAGMSMVLHDAPWLAMIALALGALAVPGARRAGKGAPRVAVFTGVALAAVSLVTLALSPAPPAAERFTVAALGLALAAGGALAPATPWLGRAVTAAAALASLGANAASIPTRGAPAFTSAAVVRAHASALAPLLAALRPWCREMASVPRTFAVGVPPDSLLRFAFDPGGRAVCHDPRVSVRFLAEMTEAEGRRPFGVLRMDPERIEFRFETADPQVRARVAEGLLVFARHAPAAACFETALEELPEDRELIYPTVSAMAAAHRGAEARDRWEAAKVAGITPDADTLAARLLVGFRGDRAAVLRTITALAGRVVDDPTSAAAHLDLGRALLDAGSARSGTLEISVACGIGRRTQDVFWLARGYDAMGARPEALEAYRAALAGGLDSATYRVARGRLIELIHALGPAMLGGAPSR